MRHSVMSISPCKYFFSRHLEQVIFRQKLDASQMLSQSASRIRLPQVDQPPAHRQSSNTIATPSWHHQHAASAQHWASSRNFNERQSLSVRRDVRCIIRTTTSNRHHIHQWNPQSSRRRSHTFPSMASPTSHCSSALAMQAMWMRL